MKIKKKPLTITKKTEKIKRLMQIKIFNHIK